MNYLKLSGYILALLMIIAPTYIYDQIKSLSVRVSKEAVKNFQFIIALAWFFNLLGSLDFYYNNNNSLWYDSFVHFVNPLMIFSMTPIFMVAWQKMLFNRSKIAYTILGNIFIVVFFSFGWEFYELIIDKIFPIAHMFGQNGETMIDTITDLLMDFIGGVCAIIFYVFYFRYYLDRQLKH